MSKAATIEVATPFYLGREPIDRRVAERRSEAFDRRNGERRTFATMADKLAAEKERADERRFTGDRLTDFGSM